MDLLCLQKNLYGQTVSVNGTTYNVEADGVCRGVKDADAKKMLTMPRFWKTTNPVVQKFTQPTGPATPLPKPVAIKANPEVAAAPISEAVTFVAPALPAKEDEEWPDPTEAMDIDYLRKMADAYEVTFDDKTTKKVLVKRITAAMYS